MKPIQLILIPLLLFLLITFQRKLRKQALLQVIFFAIMAAAMLFTLLPDLSTRIANLLGIGRGVDLIIYMSLLGLTMTCLLLYLRILKLQRMLTEVVRGQALREAEAPTSPEAGNSQ